MTVPSTTRRAGPFTGNGSTTTFPFTFKSFAAGELAVYRTSTTGVETLLALTTDYTVTLNPDQDASPGGSVTPGLVLAAGEKLTIIGATGYTQELDLPTGGQFAPRALEDALDRTVMQIQQLEERADRSLVLPVSAASASTTLPVPAAGNVIGWDDTATGLRNIDPATLASVVAYSNRRTLVANGGLSSYTLAVDPGNVNNTLVAVGGVVQTPGVDYTVSGTTLTPTPAWPAGTGNVVIVYGQALPVGTQDASTVNYTAAGTGAVLRTAQAKLRESVSVADFGAVGDGVTNDGTAFSLADATGLAYAAPNGTYKRGSDVQRMADAMFKTVTASESVDGKFLEWREVTNPTGITGYAVRFAVNLHTGNINSGRNSISDTLITRYTSIQSGFAWGRWDVVSSPLPVGSGLLNAPTVAQSFFCVTSEVNPQNRNNAPAGWQPENRLYSNPTGGEQMVAETQDFTGTLGNTRVGYDVAFGYAIAKSPYTANFGTTEHAKFINGTLINPNALSAGGYGLFATGYKRYLTAIAIANAGSGYAAGQILTLNTGLDQNLSENSQVRVLTVNGAGAITSAELWVAGSYHTTFAATVGVTGGTGTGATFTYTSSTTAQRPRALLGLSGDWLYGFDACPDPAASRAATFANAMIRGNAQQTLMSALNNAASADIPLLRLDASDRLELVGAPIYTRATYTPTYTADSGSLGTVSTTSARFSVMNRVCQFSVSFQIVSKSTATGAIRVSLPVAASASFSAAVSGVNSSSTLLLAGTIAAGASICRVARYDGVDPMVDGSFYVVTGSYEI